ncbi:MAG: hypothetical protein GXP31_06065, partial [Kiritimatiellaeota bacterium]|nr:hypothetical protein [Kiritimatiellota bacterium]
DVREFNWVEVPVTVGAVDLSALLVEIDYGASLDFLDGETDAAFSWDARVQGTATKVWDDDETNHTLFVAIYDAAGSTAVSTGNGVLFKLRFRVKVGASTAAALPLTLTANTSMVDTSGQGVTFVPGNGSVTVDTKLRKLDVDEDSDADSWDAVCIYRALLLRDLGYGAILPETVRDAHGQGVAGTANFVSNFVSDEEIRANVEAMIIRQTGGFSELDVDQSGGVTVGVDGVDTYVYLAAGTTGDGAIDARLATLAARSADGDAPVVTQVTDPASSADTIQFRFNESLRDAAGNLVTNPTAWTEASGIITQADGETYNLSIDADARVLTLTPTGASWTAGVNRDFKVEAAQLQDVATNGVAADTKTVALP